MSVNFPIALTTPNEHRRLASTHSRVICGPEEGEKHESYWDTKFILLPV